MTHGEAAFAARIIDWQRRHGRHGLPWQATREPYRVWLSEIMLQQTQVSTVLGYYARFLERFPDVASLSAATEDDVLALWSGLGYYSRARNLHRCAREVMARFGGVFPRTAAELATLPGIGRSTAAAIAAFCFGERAAILDGNVKRVLTRAFGIADDLSQARHEKALWARAEALLPVHDLPHDMPAYTQGVMDLGASICTLRRPACTACPLVDKCVAAGEGQPERYPVRTRRLVRGQITLWLLHARDAQGRVWLRQQPEKGIWARLYCLPPHDGHEALMNSLPVTARDGAVRHAPFRHVLTHRDLDIHVVSAVVRPTDMTGPGRWCTPPEWAALGLPAPIRKFLQART
ncbi:MAG: A/G-specific adenine glycosylase [Pseudomonadota bacterium]|nr:A/G-specific adenine glycosylase [Pseudomonadota bacterium]